MNKEPEGVTGMTTFGGIELGLGGSAVFEVTSESDDTEFTYPLPDGSDVVIPASSRFVVVRHCPGSGFTEVHANAREAANRGIDVYFGQGGRPLVVAHKDSPYLIGWDSAGERRIRAVSRSQLATRFRATGVARDVDGNIIESPPPSPKVWHECLRYYRMSEASADLYDSFRNLYLAIESLLSEVVPPVEGEGDKAWLKRALRVVADTVDLAPYAPTSNQSPYNGIHQELYVDLRTAMFHAKTGWLTWTPQAWMTRSTVIEARTRYARLYRRLADEYVDIRYPSGGFFKGFWESTWEELMSRHVVFASNDPTMHKDEPKGQYQLAPAGGAHIQLQTQIATDMHADWCRGVEGVSSAETIRIAIDEIRRFGTLVDGQLAMVESLQAPLIIGESTKLSLVILVEGRNYGQPRQDYET